MAELREQKSWLGQRVTGEGRAIPQRRTSGQRQANPHRTGHYTGLHPEDQPYMSRELEPPRREPEGEYDVEEDEEYYVTRPHTSARRYPQPDEYVFQQGNKRFVVHPEPPPIRRQHYYEEDKEPRPKRHVNFLVYVGIALFIMIAGWVSFSALGNWRQGKQDDWQFGQHPRTYQADAVVGHSDSSTSPSHFIALNLNGQIIIIELPGGNAAKARIYHVTTIQGNEGNPPVKISFQDINADGKLDMIISIGDPGSTFTIMLFNDGAQFVSKLSK